jgi:hypothetical protein
MLSAEICHAPDLGVVWCLWDATLHISKIALVHGQDQIKLGKVGSSQGPRTTGQFVTPAVGVVVHPGISVFALMPPSGACGVAMDFLGFSGTLHQCGHHAFGGGRATDVAQADEEEFGHRCFKR